MAVASIWSLLYVWVRGRMPEDATRREAALTAMPRTDSDVVLESPDVPC